MGSDNNDNYDWDDYNLGYGDGKQDNIASATDLYWLAIPTKSYTENHPYWDGYGDGWYHEFSKRKGLRP